MEEKPADTNYTSLKLPFNKFHLLFPAFIVIFFLILFLGVFTFVLYRKIQPKPQNVACTMEAKICPDGSAVGRVAPTCDFSPCSKTNIAPTPTPFILQYKNEGILLAFNYSGEKDLAVTEPDSNFNFTPLKSDKDISVGYQNSDVRLMGIYYWKSDLSAKQWWNNTGKDIYNEYVFLSHNAGAPTEKPYLPPTFKSSDSEIGGKQALVERGYIEVPQQGGDTIISIVSYEGGIYLFNQIADVLPNQEGLQITNNILSTIRFLPKDQPTDSPGQQ